MLQRRRGNKLPENIYNQFFSSFERRSNYRVLFVFYWIVVVLVNYVTTTWRLARHPHHILLSLKKCPWRKAQTLRGPLFEDGQLVLHCFVFRKRPVRLGTLSIRLSVCTNWNLHLTVSPTAHVITDNQRLGCQTFYTLF